MEMFKLLDLLDYSEEDHVNAKGFNALAEKLNEGIDRMDSLEKALRMLAALTEKGEWQEVQYVINNILNEKPN